MKRLCAVAVNPARRGKRGLRRSCPHGTQVATESCHASRDHRRVFRPHHQPGTHLHGDGSRRRDRRGHRARRLCGRYALRELLCDLRQWPAMGAPHLGRHDVFRRAHLPQQPTLRHGGARGPGWDARARHQPDRQRRYPRGSGRHELRADAGPLQPGDSDPLRLRGSVRGEVPSLCPPRTHRHRVGRGATPALHDVHEWRLRAHLPLLPAQERDASRVRQRPGRLRDRAAASRCLAYVLSL